MLRPGTTSKLSVVFWSRPFLRSNFRRDFSSFGLRIACGMKVGFDWCRDNLSHATAKRGDILFFHSFRFDGVVKMDRDVRRPQHPVAGAMMAKRSHDAYGHNGNAKLLRHAKAAFLEFIHVTVSRPLG